MSYALLIPTIIIVYAFGSSLLGIFYLSVLKRTQMVSVGDSVRCRILALFFNVKCTRVYQKHCDSQCSSVCHVCHVQHCVYRVVWQRGSGICDGAELGPSERGDFGYGKEGGINFAKAHLLARDK
jgi:hypothetical protein